MWFAGKTRLSVMPLPSCGCVTSLRTAPPQEARACVRLTMQQRSKYLAYCHPGEQQDEQNQERTPDGHDDAAPATVAPAPTYNPLPAQREQAEIQEDGQAHAKRDAHHYPEEATPTQ